MSALDNFDTVLDEADKALDHIEDLNVVRKIARHGRVSLDKVSKGYRKHVKRALKTAPDQAAPLELGLFALIWGAFEKFAKESLYYAAEEINTHLSTTNLDDTLCDYHTKYSCLAISGKINGSRGFADFNVKRLSYKMNNILNPSNAPELSPEAFTIIDFKWTSDEILEAYKRVGLIIKWDDIGKNRKLKVNVNRSDMTSAGNAAKDNMQRIYKRRCEIAHSGNYSHGEDLDLNLRDSIEFMRCLSTAIIEAVDNQINSKFKSISSNP